MSSRHAITRVWGGNKAQAVLVVDDHSAMRQGLVRLLESEPGVWGNVVAAATLDEARAAICRQAPDLVILDLDLVGDDGLNLLPELATSTRVLVLTSHGDQATQARSLRMGALALADKKEPAGSLLACIHAGASPCSRGDQPPSAFGS